MCKRGSTGDRFQDRLRMCKWRHRRRVIDMATPYPNRSAYEISIERSTDHRPFQSTDLSALDHTSLSLALRNQHCV
jgi:hypothetical protein